MREATVSIVIRRVMERIKDFIGEPFDTDVPIMENGVQIYC